MKEKNQLKKRHGFITFWLTLIIIGNSIMILINIFAPNLIVKSLHYPSQLIMILYTLVAIINIVNAIMILKWKKWAFYSCIFTALVGALLNSYVGSTAFASLIGLISIPFLYGILQLTKDNISAWDNLEEI